MLEDVKAILRISNNAYDAEINDLIEAAKIDLKLSGVNVNKTVTQTYTPEPTKENPEPDPLIKRAIIVYVKANFGWNNPDAEKLQQSFRMLETHLALSQEYAEVTEDVV